MKSMYQCEGCGSMYDEYSDCLKCEESHLPFRDEFADELRKFMKYKPNEAMPTSCIMVVKEVTANDDGDAVEKFIFGSYKLDKVLPDNDPNVAKMIKERDEREEQNRIWWENYKREQAEREAKKAAEEQAQAEEGETANE